MPEIRTMLPALAAQVLVDLIVDRCFFANSPLAGTTQGGQK